MRFDKNVCISNIYYIAKQKGIRIGDIEAAAGVSTGYISRLNKEDNKAVPGVDFLVSVAEMLEVSLESILRCDYKMLTEDEQRVVNFQNKLIQQTLSYELAWKKQSHLDITAMHYSDDDNCYYPEHPLMTRQLSDETDDGSAVFYSSFYPDHVSKIRRIYVTTLNNVTNLYILEIECETHQQDEAFAVYEMYMAKYDKLPVCCARKDSVSAFIPLFESLFTAVENSSSHMHLTSAARDILDAYINGTYEDEEFPF